jgi:hypothetical protein
MTTTTKKRSLTPEARSLARRWQKRLGLGDWEVEVKVERDLNGALGDALVLNEDARWAQIAIAENCPREQLEPTVVHELLEVLAAGMTEAALAAMSERAFDRWESAKERLMEHLTRSLLLTP